MKFQKIKIIVSMGLALILNAKANDCSSPYAKEPDGCSGWQRETEVRDTWGPVNFTPACNEHDKCYYTLGSRFEDCNKEFYRNLKAACDKDLRVRLWDITLPPQPRLLKLCYDLAGTYYTGVQIGVILGVFGRAQEMQRRYEEDCRFLEEI